MARRSEEQGINAVAGMLNAWALIPDILSLARTQSARLDNIQAEISKIKTQSNHADCWLDAKAAAEYLGVSAGTFDKYRYKTTPRIEGCALDGKTLYKKSELDNFVMLYAAKSEGMA